MEFRYDGRDYELSRLSKIIANKPEKKTPIEDYLKGQGRFRHLFRPEKRDDLIKLFQDAVDQEWDYLQKLASL